MKNKLKLYKEAAKLILGMEKKGEEETIPSYNGLYYNQLPEEYRSSDRAMWISEQVWNNYCAMLGNKNLEENLGLFYKFKREALLKDYDTLAREQHAAKMDVNSPDYDSEYALRSAEAAPDYFKNYGSKDFKQGYDNNNEEWLPTPTTPLTYSNESLLPKEEPGNSAVDKAGEAFLKIVDPAMAWQFTDGKGYTPDFFKKLTGREKVFGMNLWPIPDDNTLKRGIESEHWNRFRESGGPKQVWSRLKGLANSEASFGSSGAIKALKPLGKFGLRYGLPVTGTIGLTSDAFDRFEVANNANSLSEAGYNTGVGLYNLAAGTGLGAEMITKTPWMFRVASKIPGAAKWLPRVSALTGPAFAGLTVAGPAIDYTDNVMRGLPMLENTANDKLETLQRIPNLMERFKHTTEGNTDGEAPYSPLYKQWANAAANLRDETTLGATKGQNSLLWNTFDESRDSMQVKGKDGKYHFDYTQFLLGGDPDRPTINPVAGYFWRPLFTKNKAPKRESAAVNTAVKQNDQNNNSIPQYVKPEGDDYYWVPTKEGGTVLVSGDQIYRASIQHQLSTHKPMVNVYRNGSAKSKWYNPLTWSWTSAAMAGSDPRNSDELFSAKERQKQFSTDGSWNPNENSLAKELLPKRIQLLKQKWKQSE